MKVVRMKIVKSGSGKPSKLKRFVKRSTVPAKKSKTNSQPESEQSDNEQTVSKISNEEFAKLIFKFPLFFATDLTYKQQEIRKSKRNDLLKAIKHTFGVHLGMPQVVRKIQNMRALVTKASENSTKKPAWELYKKKLFGLRYQNTVDPLQIAKQSELSYFWSFWKFSNYVTTFFFSVRVTSGSNQIHSDDAEDVDQSQGSMVCNICCFISFSLLTFHFFPASFCTRRFR